MKKRASCPPQEAKKVAKRPRRGRKLEHYLESDERKAGVPGTSNQIRGMAHLGRSVFTWRKAVLMILLPLLLV
jgi:hypothetical protein